MHDTKLWGFKRTSVARGCAIGLFCCMIPMPLQMLLAAAIALVWKANIPLSVALVWVSNPLTMAQGGQFRFDELNVVEIV